MSDADNHPAKRSDRYRTTDPRSMKRALRFLGITLAILVVATIGIWANQTDWGRISIDRQNITASDGSKVSMLVYTPSSATADSKAPLVVVNHGRSNQAHSNDTWCMELARRGYVVISPDLWGGGESTEGNRNLQSLAVTKYGKTLPQVDPNKVNIIGYSMGVNTILEVANNMPGEINSSLAVFGPFMVDKSPYSKNAANFDYDFGIIKADADQYDFNFIGDPAQCRDMVAKLFGVPSVESGQYITSPTGHQYYYQEINGALHQTGNISTEAINAILGYEMTVEPAPNPLPVSNQAWVPQQLWSGVACLDMMFVFAALVQTLMELPFFRVIRNKRPNRSARSGAKPWIIDAIVGVAIPLVLFVPVSAAVMNWFGTNGKMTNPFGKIFTSINFNGIVGWLLVAIGLISIIRIVLTFYRRKKQGRSLTLSELGLAGDGETRIAPSVPLKALLIGIIVITIIMIWLAFIEDALGINYQVWNLSEYAAPSYERLVKSIPYAIVIFIVMMLGCSNQRILPSTGNERADTWISVAVDTVLAALPLFILLFAQYGGSLAVGTGQTIIPQMGGSVGALDFSFGYCYMMGGTTGVVTYFYRKYGNIWIGVIPSAIFAAFITLTTMTLMA